MSFRSDVPTAATRHFSDQSAHVKPLQQTAHCRALAATTQADQRSCHIAASRILGVAEATHQMVAIQDGLEQFDVRSVRRVETRITSTVFHHRLGDFF